MLEESVEPSIKNALLSQETAPGHLNSRRTPRITWRFARAASRAPNEIFKRDRAPTGLLIILESSLHSTEQAWVPMAAARCPRTHFAYRLQELDLRPPEHGGSPARHVRPRRGGPAAELRPVARRGLGVRAEPGLADDVLFKARARRVGTVVAGRGGPATSKQGSSKQGCAVTLARTQTASAAGSRGPTSRGTAAPSTAPGVGPV